MLFQVTSGLFKISQVMNGYVSIVQVTSGQVRLRFLSGLFRLYQVRSI
jgi:hypothetical protein